MRPVARRRPRGLTLVEVVVALAVLSLVVLALAASLRGASSVSERLDRQAAVADGVGVATGLLRELFERWVPVRTGRADDPWLFEARHDAVAWVSAMPPRFGAMGLHAFHLGLEGPADGPQQLVLRFAPIAVGADRFPDWSQAQARVLLGPVSSFSVSYGGGLGLTEGWAAERATKDGSPARLRIDLGTSGGPWPPLVFIVRTPSGSGSRAAFGGSS